MVPVELLEREEIALSKETAPILERLSKRTLILLEEARQPDRQHIMHKTTEQRYVRMNELAQELLELIEESEEHL